MSTQAYSQQQREGAQAQSLKKEEDQQMREEQAKVKSTSKEEAKMAGVSESERGLLPREDLWKDFDDWYKSIWEDFSLIDREIDRRFRDFSNMMFENRRRQIEDFRKEMEGRAITSGAGAKQLTQ
jgi:hypothetical protein